ncbi:chromosome segregation protein SMC [Desulfonema ishimotonii]|uniref:Chromosome segregation protein SMC n=1 Tax=Desulfonema ishimotonii TaxID=45657 RepID=A0A401G383_9BACT|nr:ATP-binding protein [Desulfonema ishimotonii]GBC63676.1 chromosome segregation protein SMC [Desulfonema ishimotonii]
MLTKLSIKGFKSLADVEVDLGQVNVFVGANGSGKTNFLEAVGFAGELAGDEVNPGSLWKRGGRPVPLPRYYSLFDNVRTSNPVRINLDFLYKQTSSELKFELDTNGLPHLEPSGDKTSEILFIGLLGTYSIFSPNTSVLRGLTPDSAQRKPIGINGGRLAEAVEDLLDLENEMFGSMDLDDLIELLDWVDNIAIVPPSRELVADNVPTLRSIIRFTDRWMHKEQNQFSAYEASEGALYVLFALVLAMHPDAPHLFAIDNFDQAMHPRLARATTRLFCRELLKHDPPRQALLTTHNPLVLDGLDLGDDRIRLFAVERDSNGATQVHRVRVSEKVLKSSAEGGAGLSLSRLWLMGRLGGVPDIF